MSTPGPSMPGPAVARPDFALTLEVEPRKPRLAWQGMDRREVAVSVPTQVVEIVRPGRAIERGSQLAGMDTRTASARDAFALPPNRLIWTNDNLVALRTLLDERDPVTRDYRYRGKVDLVYIDPPFMVNNDFRADNSVDIEMDDEAGVQAKKEPSLVELLAYKDTWRQGLDTFLSMLRTRLLLLKEMLAPTGSIYVHLDWHAVHYAKVVMDEVFGYENFVNQVSWKRSNAHNIATAGFTRVDDSLLIYSAGQSFFFADQFEPYGPAQIRRYERDETGRFFTGRDLTFTGKVDGASERTAEWRGSRPPEGRVWGSSLEKRELWWREGRILKKKNGCPRLDGLKTYLDETNGNPLSTIWADIDRVGNTSAERLGYPTQKPIALLERIIRASCPPGGLVLDCFMGSGTTCEAAERLGRNWIGIDNGKYAVHLARKRLIQLHGQPRPPEKPAYDYVECDKCRNIERKERRQRSPGPFQVRPFTVENMGVYQRAEAWQDFQTQRSKYRDEMIKVFGGEPVNHSPLLHGRKGHSWVHIGPLDGPVSFNQIWSIAREAQRTDTKSVTVLSADFDTLSASEKDQIKQSTGVDVTIRVIPASAIDEVRRRLEIARAGDAVVESMAVPAFYAPLSIVLGARTSGRNVSLRLERCDIDIDSFITSQRPVLKAVTEGMSESARKKAEAAQEKWADRRAELEEWLAKAKTWEKVGDFWAVDWDYGRRVGPDDKPVFETDWQSFRTRSDDRPLVFAAEFRYEQPGAYRVAARVTDVFGNDGIATVNVEVK